MRGNITRRGKSSWRLKFDLGIDVATGKRQTQFVTVRGTKKEAEAELSRRLNQVEEGSYVEKTAATVDEYCQHWLKAIAPSKASAKTLERYREIVDQHIKPRLGATALQKLDGTKIDTFYGTLRTAGRRDGKGGLSPQTVLHIHRLLSQILASAVKARKLRSSPMEAVQTTPKVRKEEIQVLDDKELAGLLKHLKGRSIYMPVMMAAATGMRRGEVLALRWKDIDLDRATLQVVQVVEETKAGISIKEPKTDRSRRTIALPAKMVSELRRHRKELAEHRLKLGMGKDEQDLVFPTWDGRIRTPRPFSKEFAREAELAGVPQVTFHGLRHTHITHLLRSGVPVHVVSARAGHANPSVTLNIYAHLLPGQQEGAAAVVDAALTAALQE
ncbi:MULTISPECIES: site-specific integrase [unclassified Mesorhizobium]|uniref:tyrosine-type recombinase/integrase n=1 Tax=unclassified Mesorhizobium TaxID=325217 RepID=UPI000FD5998D|nr:MULTISPECIES: site-specific integrase [unclassified Mesorhizobium]RUW21998.1 site-specific integrase [Mesorhizobium sp. M4B.F.Ca.ET.013.02.1.1]